MVLFPVRILPQVDMHDKEKLGRVFMRLHHAAQPQPNFPIVRISVPACYFDVHRDGWPASGDYGICYKPAKTCPPENGKKKVFRR